MVPEIRPSGKTAILAPGSRGVDPDEWVTVTSARGWPARRCFSSSPTQFHIVKLGKKVERHLSPIIGQGSDVVDRMDLRTKNFPRAREKGRVLPILSSKYRLCFRATQRHRANRAERDPD